MAKNSKPKTPAKKAKAGRRRTRLIALEPRMLFDGALGVDLSAKATAALQGDSSAPADTTATPATPEPQQRSEAAKPVEKPAEKANERALDQQIESLEARPGAEPKELVFVDPRVENAQEFLKNIDSSAKIVMLDPAKNGVQQIVDSLAGEGGVSAIHIVAMGTGERLLLGSGALDATAMQ